MGRASFIALAGALLLAGIYAAAIRGVADVHYTRARLTLEQSWSAKPGPRTEDLAVAQAALHEASRLEPDNPMFVEQAAHLHELSALRLERDDPRLREGLLEALAGLRRAALMRPGSPYVWANIAELKLRLDDMDFEFYGALERAARLGPWEPRVQLTLVNVGLAAWGWLATAAKPWVIGALDRAMRREEPEVRRLAASHGSLPSLCSERQLPSRVAALCVKK